MAEKEKLAERIHHTDEAILAYSDCMKHGESSRRGPHSLRFHTYLIALSSDLKGAVAFVYGLSFAVVKKLATGSRE